jgi:hypothetical protein
VWVQAHAWLAEAYEKLGNTRHACEAYASVLSRWKGAAASVSAREAKARSTALHCPSGR